MAKPRAREEFNKLKEMYDNNMQLAYRYYSDPVLQSEFKILYFGATWLISEYVDFAGDSPLATGLVSHRCGAGPKWTWMCTWMSVAKSVRSLFVS